MKFWETLVGIALLGTERQGVERPTSEDPLLGLIAQLDPVQPEHTVLSAAGAIALHRQAGQRPSLNPHVALPTPSEPEVWPPCQGPTVRHLELVLSGAYSDLLPEMVQLMVQHGWRAPENTLPDLLEQGRNNSPLREDLLHVVGKRGRWLAAQNPQWEYAAADWSGLEANTLPPDLVQVWAASNRTTRQMLLRLWRSQAPNLAREHLAAHWGAEMARDRAKLLETLQVGLSPEDEGFLEAALDDRSKDVRRVAADLLVRLPGSAFCHRMVERGRSHLRLTLGGDRPQIAVTPPTACGPDLQREGLDPKPPSGKGEKAWWLQQLVGSLPLTFWSQSAPPVAIVSALLDHDWQGPLLTGLALAAERQDSAAWAEALLTVAGDRLDATQTAGLAEVLPSDRREAWLMQRFESTPASPDADNAHFLWAAQYRRDWSAGFSRQIIARMAHYIQHVEHTHWEMRMTLPKFARFMAPDAEVIADALTLVTAAEGRSDGYWIEPMQNFVAMLQFRQEMHHAFGDRP